MRGWSLVAFWLNPLDFYHKSSSKAWATKASNVAVVPLLAEA